MPELQETSPEASVAADDDNEDIVFSSGDVTLEPDPTAGQLYQAPREIGEDSSRVLAQDFWRWGVRADVIGLYRGTYRTKPALLVVFEVRFAFPRAVGLSSRLSEAKIVATFSPVSVKKKKGSNGAGAGGSISSPPVVRMVCPRLIEGPVNRIKIEKGVEVAAGLSIATGTPVQPSFGVTKSQSREFVRDAKMRIRGTKWPSSDDLDAVDDEAQWIITENSALGEGVPDEFRGAAVIELPRATAAALSDSDDIESDAVEAAVQVVVKVVVKTRSGLRLLGWPWSGVKPALLRARTGQHHGQGAKGVGVSGKDFSELEGEVWERLCEFDGAVSECKWS